MEVGKTDELDRIGVCVFISQTFSPVEGELISNQHLSIWKINPIKMNRFEKKKRSVSSVAE